MTDLHSRPATRHTRTGSTSRTLRIATIVLLLVVAALYVLVLAIQLPHIQEPDNPAPVYGFLAIVYVVSAAVYAWRDTTRVAWGLGALQVVVVALFAWSVWLLYGDGEEAFILDMRGPATAVTLTQVVVLALLVVRALRRRDD